MELLLFNKRPTPRFRYVAGWLFGHLLPCRYRITTDLADFRRPGVARLHYGTRRIEPSEVFLAAGSLLQEDQVRPVHLELFSHRGLPAFFPNAIPEADLPFDLLSMIFFMVSRYEEYLPFEPDRHGRFPATASAAHREGFLETPLIDLWALRLAEIIKRKFPKWSYQERSYRFLPTYDIDLAWAYQHRSAWLQVAGSAKSLLLGRWSDLRLRWQVLTGRRPDPYFTFPYLDALHQTHKLQPRYFFLLGNGGRYDRSIAYDRPALRKLIQRLSEKYELGIHPSYRSNHTPGRLEREIHRLQDLTGRPVKNSRQHYLRLHLPDTYRRLARAGIRHDFSMGYADAIGFRAGTATSFPWYDLDLEQTSELMIHPFQVMDVSLRWYLRLTPEQAGQRLARLIEQSRAVGGTFCSLWHNSSFSKIGGWAAWKEVYERMIQQAK